MKTLTTLVLLLFLTAFVAEESAAQTKPRLKRKTADTSQLVFKRRRMLRITDTTGIGFGRKDTVRKFNFKPSSPSLPLPNNPNPHEPRPVVTNPNAPARPEETAPADTVKTPKK